MQEVVDRVMRAYGLMVTLAPEEEDAARKKLADFLKDRKDTPNRLSVEGMKFLRGDKVSRSRRARDLTAP